MMRIIKNQKPWKSLDTVKADLWYYWLERAGFEDIYTEQIITRRNLCKRVSIKFVKTS